MMQRHSLKRAVWFRRTGRNAYPTCSREWHWAMVGRALLLALLRFYQRAISPALPSACKFYPSCSEYAVQAITRYGPARGGWMAARRLCRCRPFHPGGYDPVE